MVGIVMKVAVHDWTNRYVGPENRPITDAVALRDLVTRITGDRIVLHNHT